MTDTRSEEEISFDENYDIANAAIRSIKGKNAIWALKNLFEKAIREIESMQGNLTAKQERIEDLIKKANSYEFQLMTDRDNLRDKDEQLSKNNIQVARITAERDAIQNLHIGTIVSIIRG